IFVHIKALRRTLWRAMVRQSNAERPEKSLFSGSTVSELRLIKVFSLFFVFCFLLFAFCFLLFAFCFLLFTALYFNEQLTLVDRNANAKRSHQSHKKCRTEFGIVNESFFLSKTYWQMRKGITPPHRQQQRLNALSQPR
ncbi:MAG: hypothetical protein ACRCSS_20410, partial [Shewanella sp.]